jgi:hypothetical protein
VVQSEAEAGLKGYSHEVTGILCTLLTTFEYGRH